jgi:hypothetical protein
MEIEDRRVTSSWVPATAILTRTIPLAPKSHIAGIRKIVLLDDDYHTKNPALTAAARYCRIPRSRAADIELYLGVLNDWPEAVKTSEMFLTYHIMKGMMHELYHHLVHGQRILRTPAKAVEEKQAERWASDAVNRMFCKLFPGEEYAAEWKERLARMRAQQQCEEPGRR